MATLIPETLPTSATEGEKFLARILRKLPDGWIVYFEPKVRRLRPDFVILAPEYGVLILEVKDWVFSSIRELDADQVMLQSRGGGTAHRELNPVKQVDGYWRAMKDACRACVAGDELLMKNGTWQGKLCFPVGAAVVFTNISGKMVVNSPLRHSWNAIFGPDEIVLAETLRNWEAMSEGELVDALRSKFRPFEMKAPFTARQIDVLRWVLFPESRLEVILGKAPENSSEVVAVLDARQEQHARSLGSGHRILSGVAGSGKTVLLLARARWLAQEFPERRTLILCYNKVLAAWLAGRIKDYPSVTVRHFDGWAKKMGGVRRAKEEDGAFGERFLELLKSKVGKLSEFDAVLVDEAQDFEPSWFRCAMAALKDPVDGDFVIVGDGNQRLYRRSRLSWKSLGIKAAGRSYSAKYDLDKNYRNTAKIAELAAAFGSDERQEDGLASMRVASANCRRRGGSKPTFVESKPSSAQVVATLEIVKRWLQGERRGVSVPPLNPQDIAILYPNRSMHAGFLDKLLAGLRAMSAVTWLSDPHDDSAWRKVDAKTIKVQTIHSAKGLQYKAVVVLGTELIPTAGNAEEVSRRLMYVAITRAENDIVFLGSGLRGFTEELRAACAVKSFPFRDVNA